MTDAWQSIGDVADRVVGQLEQRQPRLTPEQIARGIKLRSQKPPASWSWAATQIGCSPHDLRCVLEHGYAERHRGNAVRFRAGVARKRTPRQDTVRPSEATFHSAASVPIPGDVLADRDRRMAMQPRAFGDPLPGQSAFDKRQGA
jgi:hypothetical protein